MEPFFNRPRPPPNPTNWWRPVAVGTPAASSPGTSLGVVGRHERSVAAVAVSPAGRTVVSLGRDGTVKFWDAALGVGPM